MRLRRRVEARCSDGRRGCYSGTTWSKARARARWRASWASAATRFIAGFATAISIAISTTTPVRYGPRPPRADQARCLQSRSSKRDSRRIRSCRRCGCSTEIRAAGYAGGYTQLKAFVRQVRPLPPPEPVIRFETPAGRQAQVDFARFRFPWGVRYALLVVLGYSRLLWCRFYPRQDMRDADRRPRGRVSRRSAASRRSCSSIR